MFFDDYFDDDGKLGASDDYTVESTEFDTDGDGVVDTVQTVMDDDGDGNVDYQETLVDTNGDGIADYQEILVDTNNDGIAEYQEILMDTNGDTIIDYQEVSDDTDGDGYLDHTEISYSPDFNENEVAEPTTDDNSSDVGYESFDPSAADPNAVVGNPEESMDNWHKQETNSSCAVAAQEFVLEDLTGKEFEESELRELAEANGWYNDGTFMYDVGNILAAMGLQVEQSQGNSIEDLEKCLANGGGVIVGVDSDELWEGTSDDLFGPGMDSDHAVQVIGIDYSNPDEPMVILNDSGCSDGCGAAVPLDIFMEAWQDSDYFMVEAYA